MGDVAEQRERMTLERARTIATLDIDDIADLLAVPVKTAYKLSQRNAIPGRIKDSGAMGVNDHARFVGAGAGRLLRFILSDNAWLQTIVQTAIAQ